MIADNHYIKKTLPSSMPIGIIHTMIQKTLPSSMPIGIIHTMIQKTLPSSMPISIRRRLHNNDQSKNGEMYAYSAAAFWPFTRHRFVWKVGVAFQASTLLFACMHEPKRKKKLFVDRCCLTTHPSIVCKYKG